MNTATFRSLVVVLALVTILCVTSNANAQCCGGGATTAFYQPAAYTAYSPVAYTTNSGWYPGYFLDRVRARLWGAPATYVAAYPSTYVAAYPSANYASYPTYTAGYAVSHAASYSPCSTCAPATQVTLRPVCTTCCDPCTTCSSCCSSTSSYDVNQTSYQQPGCTSCGSSTPQPTYVPESAPSPTIEPQPNGTSTRPELSPSDTSNQQTPSSSLYHNTTPSNGSSPQLQPLPQSEPNGQNGINNGDEAASLEAPLLFSPNDRAAQHKMPSVRTALYNQPISYSQAAARPTRITAEQARQDAIGWTSAANR